MSTKFSRNTRSEKFYFVLTLLIRLSLVIAIAGAALETVFLGTEAWITLFVSSVALILTFLPHFIQQTYKIRLPGEIQIIIVLFIYAALFLGMAREWYARFWWWDSLMHGFSGVALGFAGFLILYVLYKSGKLQGSPFVIVLFSFCFAVAVGAIWEIFEFGIDSVFGDNMQRARYHVEEMETASDDAPLYRLTCTTTGYTLEGLEQDEKTRVAIYDTMLDMILNTVGALIASVAGYIYLKRGEIFLFDKLIRRFEKINPEIFSDNST